MATPYNTAPETNGESLPRSCLYLVFGTDEYLVSQHAKKLAEQLCPDVDQGFGLEIVDPSGTTVADAVQALNAVLQGLQTMSFFGEGKVVWLRDARFMGESRVAQSDGVKSRLGDLQRELKKGFVQDAVLLLSCGKLDKRLAFFKACKEHGQVVEFSRPDKAGKLERHARTQAMVFIRETGLTMSGANLDAFLARAGVDTRQIAQEVNKLSLFVGVKRDVTMEDIYAIVSPSRQAAGWDLADAVAQRDLPRAIQTLRRLLFQNESAVGMMFLLENRFRELLVMQQCLRRAYCKLEGNEPYSTLTWKEEDEVDEALGALGRRDPRTMHPYRAVLLCRQTMRFTRRELLRAEEVCLDTHEALVSATIPSSIQIELLLMRLLGSAARS